jgi:hypothetical protein
MLDAAGESVGADAAPEALIQAALREAVKAA